MSYFIEIKHFLQGRWSKSIYNSTVVEVVHNKIFVITVLNLLLEEISNMH